VLLQSDICCPQEELKITFADFNSSLCYLRSITLWLFAKEMWINNIKMDLLEIGLSAVDWIGLAQVESSCELGNEPSGGTQLHRVS
jgi:hypothetical protein